MPLKKIGRAIKKTVRKIIPKEVSGIMQVAAPFVAAKYGFIPGLATSVAGQLRTGRGRISPLQTLLAVAPSKQFRGFTTGDVGLFGLDSLKLPAGAAELGTGLDQFLYGMPDVSDMKRAQGLFGFAGDFKPLQGNLLAPGGKLSTARVGAAVVAGLTLTQTQQQIEEEGEEEGLEPSEIARLQQEAAEIWEDFDTTAFKPNVAQGGLMRANYALGSRPTEQESGLGGLPIEADMRYSGGFMPYGAKEKADDVPARLSKNEFVFTADAVRGAGGGDINTGAKRMYQSMKQLEQMGKRA